MKLATIWSAYKLASKDIRLIILEEQDMHDSSRYAISSRLQIKMMRRLRQQWKFDIYIAEAVAVYDELLS